MPAVPGQLLDLPFPASRAVPAHATPSTNARTITTLAPRLPHNYSPAHTNLQEHLRAEALKTNELLRHFWGCMPLTSAAKAAKAAKLSQHLAEQRTLLASHMRHHAGGWLAQVCRSWGQGPELLPGGLAWEGIRGWAGSLLLPTDGCALDVAPTTNTTHPHIHVPTPCIPCRLLTPGLRDNDAPPAVGSHRRRPGAAPARAGAAAAAAAEVVGAGGQAGWHLTRSGHCRLLSLDHTDCLPARLM